MRNLLEDKREMKKTNKTDNGNNNNEFFLLLKISSLYLGVLNFLLILSLIENLFFILMKILLLLFLL